MNTAPTITVVSKDGKPVGTAELDPANGIVTLRVKAEGHVEIPFTTEFMKAVLAQELAGTTHGMNSATWPWVLAFARRMEAKLEANRHKGDREGWMSCTPDFLFDRLRQESLELGGSIVQHRPDLNITNAECVADEAADVANFAMMIADVVGGLGQGGDD